MAYHIARLALCFLWALHFSSPHVQAQSLVVSGEISDKYGSVSLDIDKLSALGESHLTTKTPWDAQVTTYTGVRLSKILHSVGSFGRSIEISALNEYRAIIPISDVSQFEPLVAYKREGTLMPVVEKGPFFLVYPFSDHGELWSEIYFNRSVWQITNIEIRR